jgi:hypothetical protein
MFILKVCHPQHRPNTCYDLEYNMKKMLKQSYHELIRKVMIDNKVFLLDQKSTPMSLSLTKIKAQE